MPALPQSAAIRQSRTLLLAFLHNLYCLLFTSPLGCLTSPSELCQVNERHTVYESFVSLVSF